MHHHLTKVTRTATIVEPSLIESITVPNCPRHVHQPQHNHGRMDHGLKQINHGKVVGNMLAGSEYHNCRWQLTNKRITHQRQIDTTVTIGEHHDSHHIFSKQFVSFFCCGEPCTFQHEYTCWRIFRHIGQREAKASSLLRTITQYFDQNTKLEATPSVKICVGQILKEPTNTTPGGSSSG